MVCFDVSAQVHVLRNLMFRRVVLCVTMPCCIGKILQDLSAKD